MSGSEEISGFYKMSTNKLDPPVFFSDPSGNTEFKKRLEIWARITNLAEKHQAEEIVCHLFKDYKKEYTQLLEPKLRTRKKV